MDGTARSKVVIGQETISTWGIKTIPFCLGSVAFFLAWYLLNFFNLDFPIAYDGGDTAFISWLIKRVIDNPWYFYSAYSGYPFGSTFLDYPLSDTGNFIIFKLLGCLTHSYIISFNLYFLLSFPVTSMMSYWVLQQFRISRMGAITGSILFTFLPFHFLRLAHLLYTWYFCVPLFIWFAFKVFSNPPLFSKPGQSIAKKYQSGILLLILSSFGVYYTCFAMILLFSAGVMGALRWKSKKHLFSAGLAIGILMAGVTLNLAPNLFYMYKMGRNNQVAPRSAAESEFFGLKLVQLLLPQPVHRASSFSNLSAYYNNHFPLVNENTTASLGVLGSVGFLIVFSVFLSSPFVGYQNDELLFLAFCTVILFFVATIGGFSTLIALIASPMIRAWNRCSVFIGFTSITAFLLVFEKILTRYVPLRFFRPIGVSLGMLLIVFGVWDQTGKPSPEYFRQLKDQYFSDHYFVKKIEEYIPGGAVYQLPYTPFPEGIHINQVSYLISYDLLRGYLHSSHLHWSSGGTIGRAGDLFYRKLALQPTSKQVRTIKRFGFNGIYIDRRGYIDHGAEIEKELTAILGHKPRIVSQDGHLSFFLL